eukprot:81579_1
MSPHQGTFSGNHHEKEPSSDIDTEMISLAAGVVLRTCMRTRRPQKRRRLEENDEQELSTYYVPLSIQITSATCQSRMMFSSVLSFSPSSTKNDTDGQFNLLFGNRVPASMVQNESIFELLRYEYGIYYVLRFRPNYH